jgi:hypothetical protein
MVKFNVLDEEKRLVAGYISTEIVDNQGDLVPIEELEKTMLTLMDRGGFLNYSHSNKSVGKILQWDVRENPEVKKKGIYVVAKIFNDYHVDDLVWEKVKAGELGGFSIGATAKEAKMKLRDGKRGLPRDVDVLHDVSLMEVSLVENPANPLALVDAVSMAKGDMSIEQFRELDYESKMDFVASWMVDITQAVTDLAKKATMQKKARDSFSKGLFDTVKSIEKSMQESEGKREIRKLLYGELSWNYRGFYDKKGGM